jgi:hypothetical protein
MAQLRDLLKEAYDEREALAREISTTNREATIAAQRYMNWERGWLFRRVFQKSFAKRKEVHETAQAKCQELNEQLRLTTLATQIDIEPETAEVYYRMRDAFSALSDSHKIWDTLERREINRRAERSVAHEAVAREPVSFSLDRCDLIQWEQLVPHLPNRTGGEMYIYPGFILYRASRQAFALIEARDVALAFQRVRFIEDQPIPADAKMVGQVWAKSNKDGSPDRRFRDNYQIPVALYGSLLFTSGSGLQEEFQISAAALGERFTKAWHEFQAMLSGERLRDRSKGRTEKPRRSAAPLVRPIRSPTQHLDVATAFATESNKATMLATERRPGWEYLLAEELLRTKLSVLETEHAEFDATLPGRRGTSFRGTRKDYVNWLSRTPTKLLERVPTCLSQLTDVCRKSEEPCDPTRILSAVNEFINCCRSVLNFEMQISLAEPPVNLEELRIAWRGIADWPIGEAKRFCDEIAQGVEVALTGKRIRAELTLATPPQIDKFLASMENLKQHPELLIS